MIARTRLDVDAPVVPFASVPSKRAGVSRRGTIALFLSLGGAAACGGENAHDAAATAMATQLQDEINATPVENALTKVNLNAVRPVLKCVEKVSPGKFRAHFGYKNTATTTVSIPVGFNNRFVPAPTHRGQPTTFTPGSQADVVQIPFNGNALVAWVLGLRVELATSQSKACPTTGGTGGASGTGGIGTGGQGTGGQGTGGMGTGGSGSGGQAVCPSTCDDHNPCTTDLCGDATGFQCANVAAPDGSLCSDGNACTTGDACTAGVCTPGTATTCTASDSCHVAGVCDPSTGVCSNPTAADGTACNDGNACTQVDGCISGSCVGANPLACAAPDACHVGACIAPSGCVAVEVAPGVSCTTGDIVINEIESNGGVPGDWVELYNAGANAVDVSGWKFKDNDDTHAFYVLPAGTIIQPGAYYVMEVANFVFGLGAPDSTRLWNAAGYLVGSYTWATHAAGTYGRCPDGAGGFVDTASTKGVANGCGGGGTGGATGTGGSTSTGGAPGTGGAGTGGSTGTGGSAGAGGAGTGGAASSSIVINEVESNGDAVGDWTELYNTGTTPVDISGWKFKDNDDTHAFYILPAGTIVAPGGFYVMNVAEFSFGLGAPDSTRLFDAAGNPIDSYTWSTHAAGTYGRCPSGTGAFVDMVPTKGASNTCGGGGGGAGGNAGTGGAGGSGGVSTSFPWPGTDAVITVDDLNVFGTNLSGLHYQPAAGLEPAILWAIQNGPSKMYRLLWNGFTWSPDTSDNWNVGKLLHYTDGLGAPDTEGLSKAEWTDSGMYVSTERNNDNNTVSRLSILRFDTTAVGAELTALNEWNLTADLPVSGANAGLEAITYIPDSALVARGFVDQSTHALYNPANYPNHGTGLFFVGLESNGSVYGYVLDHATNGYTRVATFPSGQISIMDLAYDRDVGYLWGYCDNTCGNKATVFRLDTAPLSPTVGTFQIGRVFDRPSTLPNVNNEGITFATESECIGGQKSFYWSDDDQTGGHAIRSGTVSCGAFF